MSSVAQNLASIQVQIAAAARAAGRDPATVRLIAVSKTKPLAAVQEAFAAGQQLFGENKVQEMVEKQPGLPQAQWHLIGHLQTNKVKYIAPFVAMIHSLDSIKLLAEIEKQGAKAGRVVPCLIQVNISDEDQKSGTDAAGATQILQEAAQCAHVRIAGLMGIAELTDDQAKIQGQFRTLRLLRDELRRYEGPNILLNELSMGMTADFALAIAEGATLVRVGSAIFGTR
jgi:pyridoxal phosphate enzyme (YggS family)